MAVKVGVSGVTVGSVKVGGSKTQVKKIVIGTPVKRVSNGGFTITNLGGVDATGAVTGSVLVYDEDVGKFVAQQEIDNTDVNGGQY